MKVFMKAKSRYLSIEIPRVTYTMTVTHNRKLKYRNFFSDFSKSVRKVESQFITRNNIIKGKKVIIEYEDGTAQNFYYTVNESVLSFDMGTF